MRKHKSNNSHQQQRRTTVNVKAMADTLGVPDQTAQVAARAIWQARDWEMAVVVH